MAVNVWNGAHGRAPAHARGLVDFEIVVRGRPGAVIEDPSGIGIRITEGEGHGDHPSG